MASHTLTFPVVKSNLNNTPGFWLLCKIGEALGAILVLPFLALERILKSDQRRRDCRD